MVRALIDIGVVLARCPGRVLLVATDRKDSLRTFVSQYPTRFVSYATQFLSFAVYLSICLSVSTDCSSVVIPRTGLFTFREVPNQKAILCPQIFCPHFIITINIINIIQTVFHSVTPPGVRIGALSRSLNVVQRVFTSCSLRHFAEQNAL